MKVKLCLLLFLGVLMSIAFAADRPPNIVIIFTDDQGYADAGSFGAQDFATPNLDRMAQNGRRFTNFHVAQAVCSASRAALLTGCYPNRIGISGALGPNSKMGLNDKETTLAEVLKAKGYATGMAGKWHLGDAPPFLPTRHGFDEYFGIPYSHDMWPRHPENPRAYPALPLIEGANVINPDLQPHDLEQITAQYSQRAVRFIERNKERPFFFYLAHNLPHVPLFVGDKFKGKTKSLYGDVIAEVDWSVGEVISALKRNNLEENTLVIFTSDNGPWLSYGDHAGSALPLREGKGTVWEGGTRVPCLMQWPGKIPGNSVCKNRLMTIDLLPTIAHLVDAALPQNKIDGLNVWPLISGVPAAKNPHVGYAFYYANNQLQAVTTGDGQWKLVLPHTYRTMNDQTPGKDGMPGKYRNIKLQDAELYDLQNDERETRNVAAQHPDIVGRLQEFAAQMRADLGDSLTNTPTSNARPSGRLAS
jgi:arylsulfatase